MGFLSDIWKGVKSAVKSVGNALKKVFKPILKPFAKILGSKFGKLAMLAVSVFTGGAALISAFSQGGLSGAANFLLQKATEVITMPIDLVSKGIGAVGKVTGMESLTTFAESVQAGLGDLANAAGSVFKTGETSAVAAESSKALSAMEEDAGLADLNAENVSVGPSQASTTLDSVAESAAEASPGLAALGQGVPDPMEGAATTAARPNEAPITPVDVPATPPPKTPISEMKPNPGGEPTGFFSKAMKHINDNSEGYKLALDTVAGMTTPSRAEMEAEFYDRRDEQFAPYAESGYGGPGGTSYGGNYEPLRQRNAGLLRRARESAGNLDSQYGSTDPGLRHASGRVL